MSTSTLQLVKEQLEKESVSPVAARIRLESLEPPSVSGTPNPSVVVTKGVFFFIMASLWLGNFGQF
jgi:hypothetical protein